MGAVTLDIARTSTINELLKSGLASQLVTSGGTAKAASPPTRDTVHPASAIIDRAYGVEVNISECKRDQHSCQGTVRNSTDSPLRVSLGIVIGPNGEVIDDLGNQSAAKVVLGARNTSIILEPDLPVKFWINDFEVASEATRLTARFALEVAEYSGSSGRSRAGGFSGGGSSGGRKTIVLRNVPIR